MALNTFSCSVGEVCRFGKYPTEDEAIALSTAGYTLFVDLTTKAEITWPPYKIPENVTRLSHPIPDRQPIGKTAQEKVQYEWVLSQILNERDSGRRVYIHCRGGHGRSATMAAVAYSLGTGCDAQEALKAVKEAHKTRTVMSDKMRKLGAPQTASQKRFVLERLK